MAMEGLQNVRLRNSNARTYTKGPGGGSPPQSRISGAGAQNSEMDEIYWDIFYSNAKKLVLHDRSILLTLQSFIYDFDLENEDRMSEVMGEVIQTLKVLIDSLENALEITGSFRIEMILRSACVLKSNIMLPLSNAKTSNYYVKFLNEDENKCVFRGVSFSFN
jgi:hypothetical protein